MMAYIQSDRRNRLLERQLYEVEVADALLNEDAEEREARLRLVQACQPNLVTILNTLPDFDDDDYEE